MIRHAAVLLMAPLLAGPLLAGELRLATMLPRRSSYVKKLTACCEGPPSRPATGPATP